MPNGRHRETKNRRLPAISLNIWVMKFIVILALFGFQTAARELKDVSLQIQMSKKIGEGGKQEAFDEAIETATRSLAEDMLGAEKVAKTWEQSKPKILKNSTKYVVFIKGSLSDPKVPDRLQVQMRLSPDALESVLRDAGLIGSETVRVLPLVQFSDSGGSKYIWWADISDGRSTSVAQGYFKIFFKQLNAQFKGKNVFVLEATSPSFRMGLPASYRMESLRKEDQMLFGQYLKADVILSGRVDVSKPRADTSEQKIDLSLQLWQTKTGRTLVETARSVTVNADGPKAVQAALDQTQPQLFAELAGKLAEAVGGGGLNLSIVKISVEGGLSPKQLTEFRKLLASVREIRSIRERLIEPTRTIFESESTVNASDLAKAIERSRFPQFKVDVASSQDDRLVLVVKGGSSG